MLVKFGRIDCLSHPLCESLLQRKWHLYGLPINLFVTSLYIFYLAALTLIVLDHSGYIHKKYEPFINASETLNLEISVVNFYFFQNLLSIQIKF